MSREDELSDLHRAYLTKMRETMQFSQTIMAHQLGMSIRAYSDLETGKAKTRRIHVMAAERVLLREAVQRGEYDRLSSPLRADLKPLLSLLPKRSSEIW